MDIDNIQQIAYTISPGNTTDTIIWESSNPKIATVNGIGEVEGVKQGTVTIIATTTSGKTMRVNVVVNNKADSIDFANSSKTISIGKKYTQKAIVKDEKGVRNDIKPIYISSDPSIAIVDRNSGKVIGLKEGTAEITAKTGGLSASYTINVTKKSEKSTLKAPKITKKGKTLYIKTTKGAKVTVKANKKVLGKKSKTTTVNSKGVAVVKFKKKIHNVLVKITIKKKGFKTISKSKRY